jgi:hypothetical protein
MVTAYAARFAEPRNPHHGLWQRVAHNVANACARARPWATHPCCHVFIAQPPLLQPPASSGFPHVVLYAVIITHLSPSRSVASPLPNTRMLPGYRITPPVLFIRGKPRFFSSAPKIRAITVLLLLIPHRFVRKSPPQTHCSTKHSLVNCVDRGLLYVECCG